MTPLYITYYRGDAVCFEFNTGNRTYYQYNDEDSAKEYDASYLPDVDDGSRVSIRVRTGYKLATFLNVKTEIFEKYLDICLKVRHY